MPTTTGNGPGGARTRHVNLGEVIVSSDAADVLTTGSSVGSCVVVGLWDPEAAVGGLLCFRWPDSKADPARAADEPAAFADTGMSLLFERATFAGAHLARCAVRLVGGARTADQESDTCAKRNVLAARRLLWVRGVLLAGESVGGAKARRATLDVGDGVFSVSVEE